MTARVDGLESVVEGRTETVRPAREMLADEASRLLWDIACPFPACPFGVFFAERSRVGAARLRFADAGVIVLDVAVDATDRDDDDESEGVSCGGSGSLASPFANGLLRSFALPFPLTPFTPGCGVRGVAV